MKNNFIISEIDKFMAEFNQQHLQKSTSQLAEIKKFKRIFDLRGYDASEKRSATHKNK